MIMMSTSKPELTPFSIKILQWWWQIVAKSVSIMLIITRAGVYLYFHRLEEKFYKHQWHGQCLINKSASTLHMNHYSYTLWLVNQNSVKSTTLRN